MYVAVDGALSRSQEVCCSVDGKLMSRSPSSVFGLLISAWSICLCHFSCLTLRLVLSGLIRCVLLVFLSLLLCRCCSSLCLSFEFLSCSSLYHYHVCLYLVCFLFLCLYSICLSVSSNAWHCLLCCLPDRTSFLYFCPSSCPTTCRSINPFVCLCTCMTRVF